MVERLKKEIDSEQQRFNHINERLEALEKETQLAETAVKAMPSQSITSLTDSLDSDVFEQQVRKMLPRCTFSQGRNLKRFLSPFFPSFKPLMRHVHGVASWFDVQS